MKLQLLGGLTARQFLRDYWHKKPLLVRNAVPGFSGLAVPRMREAAGLRFCAVERVGEDLMVVARPRLED